MTGISYFIIHLLAITLPGWIIVRLMGLSIGQPVFILATSYVYYVLLGALSKWLDLPLSTFIGVYVALLVVMAVFSLRIHPKPQHQTGRQQWLTGLLLVILSYIVYRYLVGPYTEVPADLLRHLHHARAQLSAITEGTLGPQTDIIRLFNQGGGLWYSFYALITSLTGLEFSQTLALGQHWQITSSPATKCSVRDIWLSPQRMYSLACSP